MIGMPSSIASVARSRRIWTNSFHTIALRRRRLTRDPRAGEARRGGAASWVLLLQLDEDVPERESAAERALHLGRRAERLQAPAREEGEPVEALGLVHVVRRDDDRG